MDKILDFLADNYIIIGIGAVLILFCLIGLIVSSKKKKNVSEDLGTQPISNTTDTTAVEQPANTLNTQITTPQAPISSVSTQNVVEPSLDAFATNNSEVKIEEIANQANNQEMLVIEDKPIEQNPTQSIADSQIVTQVPESQSLPNEQIGFNQPVNNIPTSQEEPVLVLNDNTTPVGTETNNISNVQAQNNNQTTNNQL